MAYVYSQLIIKEYKKFTDIPNEIKDEVRAELISVNREDLILE